MELKKMWLLEPDHEEPTKRMLINNDPEITKVADIGVQTTVIDTEASIDDMKKALNALKHKLDGNFLGYEHNAEVLHEALTDAGIKAHIAVTSGYEEIDERIVYDGGQFTKLKDMEAELYYLWVDNVQYRDEILSPDVTEMPLEVFPDPVSLDELNGFERFTGRVGLHQNVYKVHTVDGDKVTDTYLVEYWSQWSDQRPKGEIMNYDKLMNHIKDLGRDVNKLMGQIKDLGNDSEELRGELKSINKQTQSREVHEHLAKQPPIKTIEERQVELIEAYREATPHIKRPPSITIEAEAKQGLKAYEAYFEPLISYMTKNNFTDRVKNEILAEYMFMYEDKGSHFYKNANSREYIQIDSKSHRLKDGELHSFDQEAQSFIDGKQSFFTKVKPMIGRPVINKLSRLFDREM